MWVNTVEVSLQLEVTVPRWNINIFYDVITTVVTIRFGLEIIMTRDNDVVMLSN